jgi:hypothetical protein
VTIPAIIFAPVLAPEEDEVPLDEEELLEVVPPEEELLLDEVLPEELLEVPPEEELLELVLPEEEPLEELEPAGGGLPAVAGDPPPPPPPQATSVSVAATVNACMKVPIPGEFKRALLWPMAGSVRGYRRKSCRWPRDYLLV